jgi:excisionase family DNA binding protein
MSHTRQVHSTAGIVHEDFMSRADVARLLGVSPNTVTRWAREGRLPSHLTLGGHHRFERSAIEQLRLSLRRD